VIFGETVLCPDGVGPWGRRLGMTAAKWLDVPTRTVPVHSLIATQPGVYFAGLRADTPVGGDPHPHVVRWQARHYLTDGHHRVTRLALGGAVYVTARVLDLDTQEAK
jgi:hypothetical protein